MPKDTATKAEPIADTRTAMVKKALENLDPVALLAAMTLPEGTIREALALTAEVKA